MLATIAVGKSSSATHENTFAINAESPLACSSYRLAVGDDEEQGMAVVVVVSMEEFEWLTGAQIKVKKSATSGQCERG